MIWLSSYYYQVSVCVADTAHLAGAFRESRARNWWDPDGIGGGIKLLNAEWLILYYSLYVIFDFSVSGLFVAYTVQ
jgi:hypothetical protein